MENSLNGLPGSPEKLRRAVAAFRTAEWDGLRAALQWERQLAQDRLSSPNCTSEMTTFHRGYIFALSCILGGSLEDNVRHELAELDRGEDPANIRLDIGESPGDSMAYDSEGAAVDA